MKTGIDAISFDVAKIHLPIHTLAKVRNIEAEKLEKGLGLLKMTLPDTHQDVVVFGANALTKLITDHNIKLSEIARIYVGTESAFDGSKPVSSFLIALMEQKFGENTLSECDVVDLLLPVLAVWMPCKTVLISLRLTQLKKQLLSLLILQNTI
jgi:hydroxymethylglutaryl-CoA synthase